MLAVAYAAFVPGYSGGTATDLHRFPYSFQSATSSRNTSRQGRECITAVLRVKQEDEQGSGFRVQRSEVRGQRSGFRGQGSEVRVQRSEVRGERSAKKA
jgi:hypothetical protein